MSEYGVLGKRRTEVNPDNIIGSKVVNAKRQHPATARQGF